MDAVKWQEVRLPDTERVQKKAGMCGKRKVSEIFLGHGVGGWVVKEDPSLSSLTQNMSTKATIDISQERRVSTLILLISMVFTRLPKMGK